MSQVIRIPSNIFKRLEKHASGFDTPANVIERLLNHYEGIEHTALSVKDEIGSPKRSTSKYTFENNLYGKGRLVLAIVKTYVSNNPGASFDKLQGLFPKHLQGSNGVFSLYADAQDIYERTGHKRHFLKPDEIIKLSDCEIAVSTEWGKGNIDDFIEAAQSIGYEITEGE